MSNTIPDGWELSTIGSLGKVVTGSTPSTVEPEYWGGNIPFISPADFGGSVYVKATQRKLTKLGASKGRLLPIDSVLVTCIGSLGGIAMAASESTTNQQINSLVPSRDNDPRFCFYNILFNIDELTKNAGTTTIPIINKSTFELINLLRPPFPEQQKIASILTAVDEVIESTTAQINKLKDLKTGMMQELLTKGIGRGGQPHSEFKDSPVGRIPKGWEVVQADSVCSKITKGTTPPKSDYVEDGKIPFLRVNNLSFDNKIHFENGVLFLSREIQDGVLARSRVYPGDILMNIVGPPLGKVAIVPDIFVEYNVNQAIIIYRAIENKINNKFLLHYLTSNMALDWFQTQSKKTSGQQNLTIEVCKDLHVPMPPLDEQDAIVRMLDSIHAKFSLATRKHSAYVELKKSLMQDLLTGKVRVNS